MSNKETSLTSKYARYLNQHSEFSDWLSTADNSIDNALRINAINEFQKIGFPTALRGNEAWKFTNVNPIANQDFDFDYAQMRKDIGDAVAGGDLKDHIKYLQRYFFLNHFHLLCQRRNFY